MKSTEDSEDNAFFKSYKRIKLLTKNQRTHKKDSVHMHDCSSALPAQTEGRMTRRAQKGKLERFIVVVVPWLHFDVSSSKIFKISIFITFIHFISQNVILLLLLFFFYQHWLVVLFDFQIQVVEVGIVCYRERKTSARMCKTTHDNGWVTLMLLTISSKASAAKCAHPWFPLST